MRILAATAVCLVATSLSSCTRYTSASSLPEHIKTVEVETFHNSTHYLGLEEKLTRDLIEKINLTPHLRVVNSGGDATIYGEIVRVRNTPTQTDKENRPTAYTISVEARVTFEDNVTQRSIFADWRVSSARSSSRAGTYAVDLGETRASAEAAALQALAREIADRAVGSGDW